ncbi:unnamed protein product, partial [Schistocephalus solidus]|uniref:Wnt inhibitory factor 1 n=1 Tax=Schistocephalus solidus TaxID=70667 RepID=A0A183TQ28_SCHSO
MSRQARNHLLDLLLALLLVCTAKCKLPADEAERVARVLEEPVWSGLQNILVPSPEASETLAIHNVALTSPVFDGSAQEVPVYGPARSRYNGCFLPVSLRLPPECDCVFPPQALFTPSCALPSHLTCPDNCSGKGHCDIATGKCTCKPGFTGENCATADPCSPESGLTPCQFKCVAVNATRVCICPSPFILQPDGVSCGLACPTGLTGTDCRTDIDECLTGSHNCQGNCGSNRTCECKKGFHGISCEKDIDKCQETGQNNCHHRCINTFGSFRCECDPGYNLDPRDNRTCVRDKWRMSERTL